MFSKKIIEKNKFLAGIIKENIHLDANNGRSDNGTMSFYIEEYLLNIGTVLLNKIDTNYSTEKNNLYLSISYNNTKISQNSLTIKIIIKNSIMESFEFIINIMVKFENNSNTEISISHNGIIDHFYLNSKHKKQDLDLLIDSAYNNIINKIKK